MFANVEMLLPEQKDVVSIPATAVVHASSSKLTRQPVSSLAIGASVASVSSLRIDER